MDIIVKSTLETLRKSIVLLDSLDDIQLANATIGPYYSSIGSHLRHILDFYHCIFKSNMATTIDLTARPRNTEVETNCKKETNKLKSD